MLILFLCVYGNLHPTNAISAISQSDKKLTDSIVGIAHDFQAMQDIPQPIMWSYSTSTMTIEQYLDYLEAQLYETKRYAQCIIDYCDRAAAKLVIAKECVEKNSNQ